MNTQCYTISNIYNGKTKHYFLLTYLKIVCVQNSKEDLVNIDIRDKFTLHYVYVFRRKKQMKELLQNIFFMTYFSLRFI